MFSIAPAGRDFCVRPTDGALPASVLPDNDARRRPAVCVGDDSEGLKWQLDIDASPMSAIAAGQPASTGFIRASNSAGTTGPRGHHADSSSPQTAAPCSAGNRTVRKRCWRTGSSSGCRRTDRDRKTDVRRGQTIKAGDTLEVKTSRELTPADGQIAICIGPLDLSKQTRAINATTFRAEPAGATLPPGQQEVVVHLIRGDQWIDLAKFTVNVEGPASSDAGTPAKGSKAASPSA